MIVQIDESLFNHKSKYNRGRRASKEQWVFGLADTSSKPAITYMETVDKRDAATLLPIIQRVVNQGQSSIQISGTRTITSAHDCSLAMAQLIIRSTSWTLQLAYTLKQSSRTGLKPNRSLKR